MDAAALLVALKRLPTSQVYAARRGVCGGTHGNGQAFLFRRVGDLVWLESWDFGSKLAKGHTVERCVVPGSLGVVAGRWLDSL